jgi:hypothetical protein
MKLKSLDYRLERRKWFKSQETNDHTCSIGQSLTSSLKIFQSYHVKRQLVEPESASSSGISHA